MVFCHAASFSFSTPSTTRATSLSITGAPFVPTDVDSLVTRDIVMTGSLASPNAFVPALRLMASGAIRLRPLISRIYPFEEAVEAFNFVRLHAQPRIKVLVSSFKEEQTR